MDLDEAWERLVTTPFLPGANWTTGAKWVTPDAPVEVRRVDPGKILRWFWRDEGKSTVEVDFQERQGKCSIRFRHHGLPDIAARDRARQRWRQALAQIAG